MRRRQHITAHTTTLVVVRWHVYGASSAHALDANRRHALLSGGAGVGREIARLVDPAMRRPVWRAGCFEGVD